MAEKKKEVRQGIFFRATAWVHRALAAEAGKEKRTIAAQLESILEERYKDAAQS